MSDQVKKKSMVSAVNWQFGSTLARRNADLLGEEPQEHVQTEKDLKSIWSILPEVLRKKFSKSVTVSNEYAPTSSKPVEITPRYALATLERVIRECPELTRAINAIKVGVGSRGFKLPVTNTDNADEEAVKLEHEDLDAFLKNICPDRTFSQVMSITVSSRKKFGFAGWEILRNQFRHVVGINPIEDTKTLKWCEKDEEFTEVERTISVGSRRETFTEMRRFRRFIQRPRRRFGRGKTIYFKEFGDERFLNKNTGEYWQGSGVPPANWPQATEILLFTVVDCGEEFPIPEWIPILPDALASRAIRICNLDSLDNSATPPMAFLIEGSPDPDLDKKIRDQLIDIKGSGSKSKALIIQVESETIGSGINKENVKPTVTIVPLAQLQTTEGMFLKYLVWLEKVIAAALRLPQLLVGNIDSTLNRSTAEVAIEFAEDWVFSPERQDIEDIINDVLLPEVVLFSKRKTAEKGVKYHRFKLGSYAPAQTENLLKLLAYAKNDLSLNEKRAVIDTVLPNQKIEAIDDDAAKLPAALQSIDGVIKMPDESGVIKSMKNDFGRALNKTVKHIYVYEPEYSDADPYAA